MSTQMIADLREPISQFTASLQREVGPAALVVDSLAAAEIVLDMFFHGDVLREHGLDTRTVDGLIGGYLPIPSDNRKRLVEDFERAIVNHLRRIIPFRPNRSYSYKIQTNGDIVITEMDLDPVATEQENKRRLSPTIFSMPDDDENTLGAYIPERMRRSA